MKIYLYQSGKIREVLGAETWHGLMDVRTGRKLDSVEEFCELDKRWALTQNEAVQKYISRQKKLIEDAERRIKAAESLIEAHAKGPDLD